MEGEHQEEREDEGDARKERTPAQKGQNKKKVEKIKGSNKRKKDGRYRTYSSYDLHQKAAR